MIYYTIAPPTQLAEHVRFFWVLESDASSHKPYIHRSMADGCAELIFHYKGYFDELLDENKTERSFSSGLHGPSQYFRRFKINESFGIFGVYLYPYAIPVLFGFPAAELSNQMPSLQTLLGNDGSNLEETMLLAKNNQQRMGILSRFLEKRLPGNENRHPAVFSVINHIIRTKGTTNVSGLAEKSFLSTRQFERRFKEFSGFSPKLYSRIIRFQWATNEYSSKDKSLTEIAYNCGYYDQSHFIHDFKEFSGHHPKQFFSGKAEGIEWRDA